jgi:hypothetical protein
VRLRESGHVINGEVFVVPSDDADLVRRIEKASAHLRKQDWRLYSLVVVPVSHIDGEAPVRIG